jgi:hypothetical protein
MGSQAPATAPTSSILSPAKKKACQVLSSCALDTRVPVSVVLSRSFFKLIVSGSAHIMKWVAESNHPASIVSDPELIDLLMTGHPTSKSHFQTQFNATSRQLTISAENA